jgi:hypothetical protein
MDSAIGRVTTIAMILPMYITDILQNVEEVPASN